FVIWHHIFSPFPYFLFVFIRRGTGENLYFNLYSIESREDSIESSMKVRRQLPISQGLERMRFSFVV
ncbi:hypothetical protein, partial [Geobacillus sp. 47C-IIb]|uniref:hypothetical protein n=1 Tax=Geobacillus sp. 47C-IIb TaxID=1963026 RepID=UPI001E516784